MGYVINGVFDHDAFRKRVKTELKKRGWNYKVLAWETGYVQGSIAQYMSGAKNSKFLPPAIADALNIPLFEENEDGKERS